MAIEAKNTLINEMERGLGKLILAADMPRVMSALADSLAGYDVQQRALDAGPDDLLDAYLSALSVGGRSPKTVERYRYIIGRMMDHVHAPTRQITVHHLRKYLSDEKARGISDRTLDGERQIFSAFFGWLLRERLIDVNPCANLGAIKYAKKVKAVYSETDLERMKFGCRSLRDRAIVAFLSATGCRISEMTQLNRDDVDLVGLECKVLGKGNKERTVYLSQVAGMTLRDYLNQRTDDLPALFVGRGTERMKPAAVRKMLVQLGAASGVDHVHPHKFRRTTATSLLRHGMPIQEVAAILGHDKLDTTMEYVVLDQSDIKAAYRKYA